ncbi:MAG: ABC transporter permease subunit [Actinomycetota bacterium]|nr:ABC transporter permease subunit [Actinomycetota bacterium]
MAGEPTRRTLNDWGRGFWFRLIGIAVLDALAIYAFLILIGEGATLMLASLIVGTVFINWVYLWPRTMALRWITPGLVFMTIFVVLPIFYTVYVSTTNQKTGNLTSKEQTIDFWEAKVHVDPDAEGQLFDLFVYTDDAGEYRFLLTNEEGNYFFGEPRLRSEPPVEDAIEDEGTFDAGEEVPPPEFNGFRLMAKREVFALANSLDFKQLVIDTPDGEIIILGLSQGRVVLASQRYVYDAEQDALIDTVENRVCTPGEETATKGNFICDDGEILIPGWVAFIGAKNYTRVATNPHIREAFFQVFLWNMVFAILTVVLTFGMGLILAIVLHHYRMKGLKFYRSVFIIPYAIPAFLSILVWRGLLNSSFGVINDTLAPLYDLLGMDPIRWLSDPTWAKVAVLLVNLWLGFPYMFLLATGALQSIPSDIQEAARTDGATGMRVFWKITFPLLMVALAPLLIGSFAFNFNNFNLIFLLTGGGPPVLGAAVPVGHTDILISFTFNLASAAGRGNNFGLAAAITMFIFLIVLVISAFSFRFTKRLEEIYGSL